jgi:putative flippase GtrA
MPVFLDMRKRVPDSVARASRHRSAALLLQFMKFGIVGVSNTLLTFVVYTLLLKVFGVWYLLASAIGFAAGAVNGFLLNRRWTFRGHVGDARTPLRWTVVQGCGLGLNEALLYLWVEGVGLDKLLGQAFATAVVTVITFLANRAWTFRTHPAHAHDGADAAVEASAERV